MAFGMRGLDPTDAAPAGAAGRAFYFEIMQAITANRGKLNA